MLEMMTMETEQTMMTTTGVVRGEHHTSWAPHKLPPNAKMWPPTPPTSPPSRPRWAHPVNRRATPIEWLPNSCALSSATATPASSAQPYHTYMRTNEQSTTSSNEGYSYSIQQGVKRVAWPPVPEPRTIICASDLQDSPQPQGEMNNYCNDDSTSVLPISVQANPPAPLYFSPPVGQDSAPVYFSSVTSEAPPVTLAELQAPLSVILRPQAPVTQKPPPVIKSQPTLCFQQQNKPVYSSPKSRGDQKWPPANYKAAKEAATSTLVTKGPAVKPRLVKKDYSSFFAQNALTCTYPGYRAPPGTQHYAENIDDGDEQNNAA